MSDQRKDGGLWEVCAMTVTESYARYKETEKYRSLSPEISGGVIVGLCL